MEVVGREHNEWRDGDTYQDTLDELMPFLAAYADENSTWADHETGEEMTFWQAIASVTGPLDYVSAFHPKQTFDYFPQSA
jgi:hypothetical protein